MVIGHQKGRDTKSKIRRNFGMPRPEGYRKALRLMKMAERFGLPLLTFIDTPAPIRASAPRNAANPRPSPATCWKWPSCGADHLHRDRRRRQRAARSRSASATAR
jgi:hypothetical protein